MSGVDELKPCPFCAGEPNLTHSDYVHDDLRPMSVVECKSCSAWVRVEDWNRRAPPAPVSADVKELVDALRSLVLFTKPRLGNAAALNNALRVLSAVEIGKARP